MGAIDALNELWDGGVRKVMEEREVLQLRLLGMPSKNPLINQAEREVCFIKLHVNCGKHSVKSRTIRQICTASERLTGAYVHTFLAPWRELAVLHQVAAAMDNCGAAERLNESYIRMMSACALEWGVSVQAIVRRAVVNVSHEHGCGSPEFWRHLRL